MVMQLGLGRKGVYTKLWWEHFLGNIHFEDQEGATVTLRHILEISAL
jgi:hypothetical protein